MTDNTRRAKFFCEFCGAEVPQNAKVCKYCGRFFASVRCPSCGFTGEQSVFYHGCPHCGYAVGPVGSSQEKTFSAHPRPLRKIKQKKSGEESLPFWIYFITFLILLFTIAGVFMCSH